ncbi:DUF4402 domain-containing protein [Geomonas oryzisoli]|uniref:DUF4402 domain-containing protein n=1 Tax=Geomonas oryzisoli TaxID=2847992 RepID=A0ABX8J6V4_9BACT|nr:DUF4402 domain-containing protein [Geomonas oryzisoli]QWV93538.1 DUF4402 domain-containing protein [Geomonas oryzisoli]
MMRAKGMPAKLGVTILVLRLLTAGSAFAAPTSVNKTQDLNFGRVVGGAGYSGTVTITSAGSRTSTGSVIPLGTTFSPARFTITGTAGKSYTITLPPSMAINAGADQMTVTAITSSIALTGVIPAGGTVAFWVGGTLNVGATQRNALYSSNMNVSVK